MSKNLKNILVLFLITIAFILGVKYSKSVKEHTGWMFEGASDEIELPDLSNTQNPEGFSAVDENGKTLDGATPPAEDSNIVPSLDEVDAPQDSQ